MKLKPHIDKNLQTHMHTLKKAENQHYIFISNSYKNSKLSPKKVEGKNNDKCRSPINTKQTYDKSTKAKVDSLKI